MLELAEKTESGRTYNIIGCLIFSAFALEAYFNHLGKLRNKDWEKIEKKISKADKFKMLCEAANVKFDYNERPYSTLSDLFDYRDTMAHGKTDTEKFNRDIDISSEESPRFDISSCWEKYTTIENAKKAIEDVEKIIKELHKSSGYDENPFNRMGEMEHTITYT